MIKKVGIIGFGNIANNNHINTFLKLSDMFEFTDVYDLSEERMKLANDLYGAAVHSSVEDFLESNVDLVLVSTPTYAHCEMALRAMEAGKNVIVEKPMAMDGQQASAMVEMATAKGVMLSVHHNRRWDKDYVTVKKLIEGGAIGRPFVIESRVMEYRNPAGVGVKEFNPNWRLEKKYGGGRLNEWGVHYLDQVVQMVDSEVSSVWADLKCLLWSKEVDTYGKCIVKFKNGVTFHMETSWVSMEKLPRWFCLGMEGSLIKDTDGDDKVKIKKLFENTIVEEEAEVQETDPTAYYKNIYDVLSGKAELAVKPEQARDVIRIADAARKSSAEGMEVYMNDR